MGWLFAPGLEDLSSDCPSPSPDTVAFATSSGKPTARPLSWRGWKRRPWIALLYGTISRPSMAARGVESWIWSLRASRASRSAPPERSSEPTTSDGSGRLSSGCLGRFEPDGSFSKTSLGLFGTDSDPSSVDWPRSGTMRSGVCYARQMLERPIVVSGSFCSDEWQTPNASGATTRRQVGGEEREPPLGAQVATWPIPRAEDSESCGNHPGATDSLTGATKAWPTPITKDASASGSRQLSDSGGASLTDAAARNWPTPDANCWKGGTTGRQGQRPDGRIGRDCQLDDASSLPDPLLSTCGPECSPKHRRLNPLFVEWLMGWPSGWSIARIGSEPPETALCHFRRLSRSALSRLVPDGS